MSAVGQLLQGENDFDFTKWWRRGAVLSVVLVLVSIGSLAARGLNLSVDFTGGVSIEAVAPGVSVDQARTALGEVGAANAKVQIIGADTVRVQTGETDPEAQAEIRRTVAALADGDEDAVSVSTVSPSWGADITSQAVRALVFFLAAIMLYLTVRLEWRMAIGAIVAVVHDIVVTVGIYSLFQFEVSPGTVIAFLTILGYSIYDTVVVYDKVKANEALAGATAKMTYTQMVSRSMNEVMLRSLNTTITSLLPVLCLLFVGSFALGAVTLSQFGIALAIGLLVGAYSSIMVAGPVLALMKEREPHYRQLRERLALSGRAGPVVRGSVDRPTGVSARTESPGEGHVALDTADTADDDAPEATPVSKRSPGRTPTPATPIPPRPRKQGKRR